MCYHDTMTDTTSTDAALASARYLAESGVPIFLARPSDDFPDGGSDGNGYWIPPGWQNTEPDPSVLDRWRPGMAVCAVMGRVVDGLDRDPRNGGELAANLIPRTYGTQSTPSGGTHDLIAPLGVHSRDGVVPGVDIKAGLNGKGTGFLYIAPTVRRAKDGTMGQYQWIDGPDLDSLILIGGDRSGEPLAELVEQSRRPETAGRPSYSGPKYADLTRGHQQLADSHVQTRLDLWKVQLADAASWPEGHRDNRGRGWEALSRDAAWMVASLAVCPWTPIEEDQAAAIYASLMPEAIAQDPKCRAKWYDGLLEKAAAAPFEQPPWADFEQPVDPDTAKSLGLPVHLDDARLAEWMAKTGLDGRWCWAGGMGWLEWDGRRWTPRREEDAREQVRRVSIDLNLRAMESGADKALMKKLTGLLTLGRISSLTTLMRGAVARDPALFDTQHHLLNVGNGVVNLRTGALLPHDPGYLLTRITETPYVPDATHPDWDQTLTALDPEVADWMQIRFGQGATGETTSDDILPIGQGEGSNGKTTLITAITSALGGHVTQVPEKLLRAGPNDHPTELMTLQGARIALIDETPEVAQLNVQRLKSVLGQEWMTARAIRKDNVTWKATHSLFVMTNYIPIVRETDRGTWRRLALVKFDRTFPKDDRFRARMRRGDGGRREAVLAWVVRGAKRWYDNDRQIPPAPAKVEADTREWRGESDLVSAYTDERLIFDPSSCILSSELLEDVNQWLTDRGQAPWSDQLVAARFRSSEQFRQHRVDKTQSRNPTGFTTRYGDPVAPAKARIWRGVRWVTDADDQDDYEDLI